MKNNILKLKNVTHFNVFIKDGIPYNVVKMEDQEYLHIEAWIKNRMVNIIKYNNQCSMTHYCNTVIFDNNSYCNKLLKYSKFVTVTIWCETCLVIND